MKYNFTYNELGNIQHSGGFRGGTAGPCPPFWNIFL